MSNKTLVTIKSFYYRHEAEIYRTKLEANGIPSMIIDGNIVPSVSFYSDEAGVKLRVFEKDVEKALEILNSSTPE